MDRTYETWNQNDAARYAGFADSELAVWSRVWLRYLRDMGLLKNLTRFFSIGPGTGNVEFDIATQTGARLSVVDPSETMLKSFEEQINKFNLSQQLHDLHNCKLEEMPENDTFELILAIHSWYFIGRSEQALRKALKLRTATGKIFIVIAAANSIHQTLYNLANANEYPYIESKQLSEWIDSLGVSHSYTETTELVPAEEYFREGNFTSRGKQIVEMLTVRDFKNLEATTLAGIGECFTSQDHVAFKFGSIVI